MISGVVTGQFPTGINKGASKMSLKKACAEFESLLLTYMLKTMRKTVTEDGLLGNSNESKIFKSMFDERLAVAIARSGGIGIGKVLFDQLNGQNQTPSQPPMNGRGGGKERSLTESL